MAGVPAQPQMPADVRVGIIAYEDFQGELESFQHLFAKLSRQDATLRYQLAVGSYGEVLNWIDRQLIDVAILTPGVFAGLLPHGAGARDPRSCRYLATLELPPAQTSWASPARRAQGFRTEYQSVCLVPEDSALQNIEDVRTAVEKRKIEFLFVHPWSMSGHVVPREALRRAGIQPPAEQVRYTYSHSQSIRMLAGTSPARERVAFAWDDAAGNDRRLESGVRQLPFPQLAELQIPHDVIVARQGFAHADRLLALLLETDLAGQRYRFAPLHDWATRYGLVRHWLDAAGAAPSAEDGESVSLEEIGHQLLQYARSQPHPPRLALVLSGGGAKCSYQVGAVAALEQHLASLRRDNPGINLDIELVVGTSGGAINALPVALGITRTEEGQATVRDTWLKLDQRDIVRPSLLIRANMGLWFALFQTAVVIWVISRLVRRVERRARIFAIVYTGLAAIEIALGYLPGFSWSWLGTNHVAHHLWLWVSFGIRASAWSLFAIGVAALLMETARARRGLHITIPGWLTKTTLAVGLLGLPLLQLVTILNYEETLSSGRGMQSALTDKFPRLIDRHLDHQGLPPLNMGTSGSDGDRMQTFSRDVLKRGLVERDFVITGSCLGQTTEDLPSDLYFYVPADPTAEPPRFGKRGLPLRRWPHILLDVVMGSGSIYPVFPAREIANFPRSGEGIELVDGGFAHNSPIEAAVLWGATHVVMLEATPRTRTSGGSFLRNATSSFRHLYRQAQLLDARSRDRVLVFSLAPAPPHLCVLDFSSNLVEASIDRGYHDARLSAHSERPRFVREVGEPIFVPVGIAE